MYSIAQLGQGLFFQILVYIKTTLTLILYDLCCTGSWASLITAQFRSQNWRGKPVLPAISSPTFYTASTSPCLFHVILVLCKGTCGFKIPSISCHNLTVYTDNTVHFIFNNASQMKPSLSRISPSLIHIANMSSLLFKAEGQTNHK